MNWYPYGMSASWEMSLPNPGSNSSFLKICLSTKQKPSKVLKFSFYKANVNFFFKLHTYAKDEWKQRWKKIIKPIYYIVKKTMPAINKINFKNKREKNGVFVFKEDGLKPPIYLSHTP